VNEDLELRVSDAERERVTVALREHCATGRLTLEELSERLDEVYRARTAGELEATLRDLPAEEPPRPRRAAKRFTISIFGGTDRKGRWRVPRRSFVLSLFGGSDLDLRHAVIEHDVVTFVVIDIFGGTDLYVPEGIEIDVGGFSLFGGLGEHGRDVPPKVGSPLVRVRALTLFGGTDVWRIPPGGEIGLRALRRLARQ
jgi:uncharacterized protein DUF1707/cell wall-active antibiotic response 4TMS protein YvqF